MTQTKIVTCSDERDTPEWLRKSAEIEIVLIHPDGSEKVIGYYCPFHSSEPRRYWGSRPGDRVEHRNLRTGEVISAFGLVFK